MRMHQPVGDSSVGPVFVRLSLGLYFVLAGIRKLDDLAGFVQLVHDYGIVSGHLATLYGTMLPYMEVFVGVLLLLGAWMTFAAGAASLMLLSFVLALGFFPTDGPFNKDIILLCGALSLLYTGAGAGSVDTFRSAG